MNQLSLSELRRRAFLDATANNYFLDFGLHGDAFHTAIVLQRVHQPSNLAGLARAVARRCPAPSSLPVIGTTGLSQRIRKAITMKWRRYSTRTLFVAITLLFLLLAYTGIETEIRRPQLGTWPMGYLR